MHLVPETALVSGAAGPRLAATGAILVAAGDHVLTRWRRLEDATTLTTVAPLRGRVSLLADGRTAWGPVAFDPERGLPDPLPDVVAEATHDLGRTRGRYELAASAIAADGMDMAVAVHYRPPQGVRERGRTEQAPAARLVLLDSDRRPRALLRQDGELPAATAIDFSATVVAAGLAERVEVWSRGRAAPVAALAIGGIHAVRDLAFSPGGEWLAAITAAGRLVVWSTSSWEPAGPQRQAHAGPGNCVAWSPDAEFVASAGAEGVHVWTRGGEAVARYESSTPGEGVVFVPGGRIAVSSDDGGYRVTVLRMVD